MQGEPNRSFDILEVVYYRDDGTESVIHRRAVGTLAAVTLQQHVQRLQHCAANCGYSCSYTWRRKSV